MPTEAELLANEANPHIRCICANVIPLSSVHCPFCKALNRASTTATCPTCGQPLKKEE